jgi:hypothetical protein
VQISFDGSAVLSHVSHCILRNGTYPNDIIGFFAKNGSSGCPMPRPCPDRGEVYDSNDAKRVAVQIAGGHYVWPIPSRIPILAIIMRRHYVTIVVRYQWVVR